MPGSRARKPVARAPLVPMTPEVGRRVKARREELGWTGGDLEARAGVDQSTISLLENNKRGSAKVDVIFSIADALGVSADYLMRGTGAPPAAPLTAWDRLKAAMHHLEVVQTLIVSEPAADHGRLVAAEERPVHALPPPEADPTIELVRMARGRSAAGETRVTDADADDYVPYRRRPGERGHDLIGVEVTGDCLAPAIQPGFVAVADLTARTAVKDGDLVVADVDGARMIKLVELHDGEPWLVARQHWEPRRVDAGVQILGVVVWIGAHPRSLDL